MLIARYLVERGQRNGERTNRVSGRWQKRMCETP